MTHDPLITDTCITFTQVIEFFRSMSICDLYNGNKHKQKAIHTAGPVQLKKINENVTNLAIRFEVC